MIDPFAVFKAQCDALIKSRVREPAGYIFEIPPRPEMGQLACNVAFQLPRLRKNSPLRIAEGIVKGMDRSAAPLVRDVQVAGPGFINFYVDKRAYARIILDAVRADGDLYGRGGGETETRHPLVEHTSVNPNKPWHIGHARNAVLGDTLARLFRFMGRQVEVQNYIDDTGKQVADMIYGLRRYGYLSDDGVLRQEPGRKLDHFCGAVYARLYEELGEEDGLRAEAAALAEARQEHLSPGAITSRAAEIENIPGGEGASERETAALERELAGWRAIAALHPSSYEARAQDIADRLTEIEAIKAGAEETQHTLERGDYRELVHACLHAQLATAWRLGIYYDLLSWEQDVVRAGLLEEALTRISDSPRVYVASEGRKKGCLVIDMGRMLPGDNAGALSADDGTPPSPGSGDEEHSTEVVLVRSNGLPTYVGKDVAYHFWKYGLLRNDVRYAEDTIQPNGTVLWTSSPHGVERPRFEATEVINVIGSHQIYPQQVVAAVLKRMGHGGIGFRHLAYGMVSARVGGDEVSMSGRRGIGVWTDDVLDEAAGFALERVREKQEAALDEDEMARTAERVAAAALRYVMVRYNPQTEIVLDPAEMVEFEGNTGAYLLYAYTRAAAILRKAGERGIAHGSWAAYDPDLLSEAAENDLVQALGRFPHAARLAAETLAVNILAEYAHEMATLFSQFYNRCPILNAQPPLDSALLTARLGLVAATAQVMRILYGILGLELVERL